MSLFTRNREREIQGFVLKVVNNNCPELRALDVGPRLDTRANLTVVVVVIPVEGKKIAMGRLFTAVTKEFSGTGVGLVVDQPWALDEVILGFRWEGEMQFVRAEATHLTPMGGGFYQLGMQMTEMVYAGDYPELGTISI